MKLRYFFYLLFYVVCASLPFRQGSTDIEIFYTAPCIRFGEWTIGQSSNSGNRIDTSFITNSEETCCVKVNVSYCES